jgi:aryl-alcohol dehydrogenase-like predicted oxidoreductase
VLAHPAVHVAIVGARDPARLAQTAAAAHVELSLDDLRRLDVILSPAAPTTGQTPEDA